MEPADRNKVNSLFTMSPVKELFTL